MADPLFGGGWKFSKGLGKAFRLKDGVVSEAPTTRLPLGNPAPNPARDRAQNSPVFSDDQTGLKIGRPMAADFGLQKP